jgi:putative ATPase
MNESAPLAELLRPQRLEDVVGQQKLIGPGMPLRRMAESNRVLSMIFWGPPGVGKTTLARILAKQTGRRFFELSAVSAGKDDLRRVVEQAKGKGGSLFDAAPQGPTPILFLDEIHRFNKAQQDFLLPYVEEGSLILIGATTENPSFEVIPALLSRARVVTLEPLTQAELSDLLDRGCARLEVTLEPKAKDIIIGFCGGDARKALNLLQDAAALGKGEVDEELLRQSLTSRSLHYDKGGEEHYNIISAYIKSMRAGDVDAATYWLARMIDAGEDPKFIARRMVIFASEDIGMASPHALTLAISVFRSVEVIGYPECSLCLAQGTIFLASAAKSRAVTDALNSALQEVRETGSLPVPLHLRNAPTQLMKELGWGGPRNESANVPDGLTASEFYIKPNA